MINSILDDLTLWLEGYIKQKDSCYKKDAQNLIDVMPRIRTQGQLIYQLSLNAAPDETGWFLARKTHEDGFLSKRLRVIDKANKINKQIIAARSSMVKLPSVLPLEAKEMVDMLLHVLSEEQCHLHKQMKKLLDHILTDHIVDKIIRTLSAPESEAIQNNIDSAGFLELLCEIHQNTYGYSKNMQGAYVLIEEPPKINKAQESSVCTMC